MLTVADVCAGMQPLGRMLWVQLELHIVLSAWLSELHDCKHMWAPPGLERSALPPSWPGSVHT